MKSRKGRRGNSRQGWWGKGDKEKTKRRKTMLDIKKGKKYRKEDNGSTVIYE